MLVRDLMQGDVVTLDGGDTLDLADDVMRLGRIRHLPVTAEGRLIGVLSQRDLFRAATSCLLALRRSVERDWLAQVSVAEVMTTPAVTVPPNLPVRQAVEIMMDRKIGCLPVVEGERLVGLISETDCLRYLVHVLDVAETRDALPELPA